MTTKVTNIYNLKLTPSQFGQSSLVVNCSQYDSLFRVIQFNLYNGYAVYSIPEGSVVTIRGTKKDNTGFEYECDFYNNVVTFPIRDQITIYPGKVPAELRIVNDGEIIGSWNFLFFVEESPLTDDTIISETELPLLESALQAASEAENYKNLAQISADNASQSAETASESEANALTYSQNAQTSANSASQSEANALTYSTNASESASEAQGYAQDAEDSATQSANSATQASQSATQAQTIADEIAGLVDEAQGYASQSLTNAQNSAQSASQASQSATNASQSASNAQTYASNANTSAQNASSSATSAQTYASNASTSATQSASSATASAQSATNAQTYANNASASATQAQGYASNASDSATASAESATESQGYAQNASDSATEAQEAVDTIDEAIKNKADIDGVYPKLVAGDLVESETKDDVFTYQKTDHTGKANINSIKGNTINWNQLQLTYESATSAGITYTSSDGRLKISGTATGESFWLPSGGGRAIDFVANHIYLVTLGNPQYIGSSQTYNFYVSVTYKGFQRNSELYKPTTSFSGYLNFVIENGQTIDAEFIPQVFDLTQMFGETKANEIYAMGETNGIAYFKSLFPLPYYQYNAGELLSFNGTGIKATGKNKVFKIIEHANIGNDGKITPINDYSLAVAEITKGYTYRVWFDGMASGTTTILAGLYTEEPIMGSVAYDGQRYLGFPRTFTAEIDGYIAFRFNYGITEAQVELGTVTTDYEPYKTDSLSLPIAQYFPTGMKSAGSVYDELTESKATTRVGTRAYQSGDENDSTLTTDGTNTNYPLATPTEEDVDLDLSYSTYEGGTEQLLPANTDVPVTSPISMNVEFDFGENLNARFMKVLNMIAPVESAQVSKAYSVGQYLIYDYTLYKVTSAIASGGTITIGTNVTATTLAEILEAL